MEYKEQLKGPSHDATNSDRNQSNSSRLGQSVVDQLLPGDADAGSRIPVGQRIRLLQRTGGDLQGPDAGRLDGPVLHTARPQRIPLSADQLSR